MVAFEVGATNYPNYLRDAYRHGVRLTPDLELRAVRRQGNRLVASLWNEYSEESVEREVDHVVVEHGVLPADEIYHELRAGSRNGGQVDLDGLVQGAPAELDDQPRRHLPPLPRRRRRLLPQHPRRDLRLAAAVQGVVMRRFPMWQAVR